MTDYTGFGTGPPTITWQNDSGAYTFGQRFRVDASGLYASKIRWWIPDGTTDAPTTGYYVALYEVGNTTPVATAGPLTATVGAWNEAAITPVALTLGADYQAAVLFPGGYYGANTSLFSGGTYDPAGPIFFYTAGRFNSGASLTYPNSTFGTPWYGVDVTVTDTPAGSDQTATLDIVLPGVDVALSAGAVAAVTLAVTLPGIDAELSAGAAPAVDLAIVLPGIDTELSGQPQGTATLSIVLPGIDIALATVGGPSSASTKTVAAQRLEALWFRESVAVERWTADTGYGPTYDDPDTVLGMVDHGLKTVLSATGEAKVSTARVFLPIDTPDVPVGSRITLPDSHGGDVATVMARAFHTTGLNTPDHLELTLE